MTVISDVEVKMAGSQYEEFTTVELFSGDTPLPVTTAETVAAALLVTGLPAHSVVGRDASGKLVLAVHDTVTPANAIKPIGITVSAVLAGSTAANVTVYRAGCFNPAALNWDVSYTTDAIKRLAFEGSGAEIVIKKNPVA